MSCPDCMRCKCDRKLNVTPLVKSQTDIEAHPEDHKISRAEITFFVLNRLCEIRELGEYEFKGRSEELLHLYHLSQSPDGFPS